jgi:predicted nucleotidyltransferase
MSNVNIDIEQKHLKIIQSILKQHLSNNIKVWVFGSRAKKNAREFSDVDLVLEAKAPVPIQLLADLASDFEESDLPYKVDLIDWTSTSESFKEVISEQRVLLPI